MHLGDTHGYEPKDVQVIEEFTQETLPALQAAEEELYRQSERKRMEECLRRGEPQVMGAAYVGYCEAVVMYGNNPYKFGGTGREDARIRLVQLSRSVPLPFRLVVSIPSMDPFKVEAELHQKFEEFRIREGACTEFFNVGLDKILEHVEANYPNAKIFPRGPQRAGLGLVPMAFGGGQVPTHSYSIPTRNFVSGALGAAGTDGSSTREKILEGELAKLERELAKARKANRELNQKIRNFEQEERERRDQETEHTAYEEVGARERADAAVLEDLWAVDRENKALEESFFAEENAHNMRQDVIAREEYERKRVESEVSQYKQYLVSKRPKDWRF